MTPLFYISLLFTTLCYFTTSLFSHCWEGQKYQWAGQLTCWGNISPCADICVTENNSSSFVYFLFPTITSGLSFVFAPLIYSDLAPLHASFHPSRPPSCPPVPFQGGRQVTALGGRRSCQMLLCLRLCRNIPPQVALATAFPFNHPTVVRRKWQHTSSGQSLPKRSLCLFNYSYLGVIHALLPYMGRLMFTCDF